MADNFQDDSAAVNEEFVRLFTRHQRQVHAYIATLLYNPQDVEEVLQETAIVLWNKFDSFQRDKSFVKWACGIAHLQVLSFRRQYRRRMLPVESATLELLLAERMGMRDQLDRRREALAECFQQLRLKDQQLIQQCYRPGAKIKDMAAQLGRSPDGVSHSLGRIRRWLFECVNRKLAAESRG